MRALSHGVADNFARINIFDASEVQPSLLCGNIRQVRHPDLIWCCRSERLVQQIWRNWQIVVRVRSRSELAFRVSALALAPYEGVSVKLRLPYGDGL